MGHILPRLSRLAQMASSSSSEDPIQTPFADSPIFMLSLPDDNHSSSPAAAAAAAASVSTTSSVAVPPQSLAERLRDEEADGGSKSPVAISAGALGRRPIPEKLAPTAVNPGPPGGRRKSFAVKKRNNKRFRHGARIVRYPSSSEPDSSADEGDARPTPKQTVGAQPSTTPSPKRGDPGHEVGGGDPRDAVQDHPHCCPAGPAAPSVNVCLEKTHASISRDELHEGGVRTEDMEGQEAQNQCPATTEGAMEDQAEAKNQNPATGVTATDVDADGMRIDVVGMEDQNEAENKNPASGISAAEMAINLRPRELPYSFINPGAGEKRGGNISPSHLLQIVAALMDHHQPNKLNDVIKMMYPDGCAKRLDNIDVLDVLKMKGIEIPQPRWYRPGGYNA